MKASDFKKNRILWRSYCADRIDRAYETDARKARIAFGAIPFLLHHNHPSLPGFVRIDESLGGIHHYSPTNADLELARERFPSYFYLPYGSGSVGARQDFESILIMGSIGTVAQNDDSDYDYWVVVDLDNFSERKIAAMKAKLSALEDWAGKLGVEAHFFLSDMEKVKNHDFGAADKESAGSSQPRALKEEFYRTVIHVAGKDPLWWLLPPRLSNREYEMKKALLLSEGGIGEDEFVDLGNAEPIPKGELYGALLWQLNKATLSPHKAALKMALIENFLTGEGASLPCESLKEIVQSQAGAAFFSDPYLLMIDYVRARYLAEDRKEAVKSLEQCFYLKSIDSTINIDDDGGGYKEQTLRQLLRFWGWKSDDLNFVNDYECWNVRKSGEMGAKMHEFILSTYRSIYNDLSIRSDMSSGLTSDDRTILGRKLFVIYDKRNPDKIEYLKRIMHEMEGLEEITLYFPPAPPGAPRLIQAFMGDIRAFLQRGEDASAYILREGPDPVYIIMWLAVNGITTGSTYVYVEPEDKPPVSPKNLRRLLSLAASFFHQLNLGKVSRDDLLSEEYVTKILAAVNILSAPDAEGIETVHVMHSTSWGEVFCHTYDAEDGMEKIARLALKAGNKFSIEQRDNFRLFVSETAREKDISTQFIKGLASRLPDARFNMQPTP